MNLGAAWEQGRLIVHQARCQRGKFSAQEFEDRVVEGGKAKRSVVENLEQSRLTISPDSLTSNSFGCRSDIPGAWQLCFAFGSSAPTHRVGTSARLSQVRGKPSA